MKFTIEVGMKDRWVPHFLSMLRTPIAAEKDLHFAVREGGKTVGAGMVTEIL